MATPTDTRGLPTQAMTPGDRVKFVGDRCWWTVRAGDERFTILTRQAAFKPAGEVYYTIIDRTRGVRGPCNLLGQGWGFHADSLDADAARLLASLQLHVAREAWVEANRHTFPPAPAIGGTIITYPDDLDPDGVWPTEVSYRNNVPISICDHARAEADNEGGE